MENNSNFSTVKSKQDFLNIRLNGQKIYTRQGIIFSFISSKSTHFSWTISKQIGNAVLRNKLKRYCRESIRENYDHLNHFNILVNIIFPSKKSKYFKSIRFFEVNESVKSFIKTYNTKHL